MPAKKKDIDWERIERDYRAGIRSVREIAAEHRIAHTTINTWAKENRIERDLGAKIRAKADALMAKEAADRDPKVRAARQATEREIVVANAEMQAAVRRAHRADISTARVLCRDLIEELSATSRQDVQAYLEQLAELVTADDSNNERFNAFMKALSLPNRIVGMDKLASALVKLVTLERTAYGIEGEAGDDPADKAPPMSSQEAYMRLLSAVTAA